MGKVPGIFFLLVLIFTSCFCVEIHAQSDNLLQSLLSAEDVKKLDKAEKYRSEADRISEEVNRLNQEIISIQADPELSEKAKENKVKKLENESIQKQITASELYEKSNKIKYAVYKDCADNFRKKNPDREQEFLESKLLEEQAGESYFKAASYRTEAKKLEGYVKIEKLNEATRLEEQAISDQLTALQKYPGVTAPVGQFTDNNTDTHTGNDMPSGNIVVNPEMIDTYNRYMSSGRFADTTLPTGKMTAVTGFDSDEMLALWYEYHYGIKDASTAYTEPEHWVTGENMMSTTGTGDTHEEDVIEESPVTTEEKGGNIYRVQIAANRTELSQRALSRMYYGTKNLSVINEDGWYKYSVGDFETFEEADEFRKSSGIRNAFVTSQKKSPLPSSTRVVAKKETPPAENIRPAPEDSRIPEGMLFRVQVAASKVPLRTSELSRVYKGNFPIEIIMEDGWYKYQIMGVRLYSDARRILENCGGGFIVAYNNGAKIALRDAISSNREIESLVNRSGRRGNVKDAEYHVQLAASRNPMPDTELSDLYKGGEQVFVIIENGWYKYHLKAGNSFELAQKLKQNCNVNGAFIVGYVRAERADLRRAIQENK